MSRTIGGIEVAFTASNRDHHNYWTDFHPSTTILPKGWQREQGFRPLSEAIMWEKDVKIPMRDGHHQTTHFTWLGVPKSSLSGLEKFEAPDPAEWCPWGYAIVNIDARGTFDSEGDIFIFGTQEGRDGHDSIEWIAAQPWCDSNVALVGNSWLAITQWFIAAEKPPHLRAIAPWEGLGDFYRESICRGGIPNYAFWDLLMQEFNPLMNQYWEDKRPRLKDIDIPMYILASYSTGLHTEGSLRAWKYASSKQKWLRIHPTQEWFDIYQPLANDDLQRFLDYFLLNKNDGWVETPNYRAEDAYPPSRVDYRTFYLDSDQKELVPTSPSSSASVSYQSDFWEDDGAHFHLKFTEPTELIGTSQVVLYMSCADLDDMDVYVILRKLDRDGNPLLNFNIPFEFQRPGTTKEDIPDENIYKYVGPSGRLRASKRAATTDEPDIPEHCRSNREPTELFFPHDLSEKVTPGEVVELRIPIWPGGIAFATGESLRLEIKGHDPILPEYPPLRKALKNLNKGLHVVHTSGKFASRLTIPLAKA